MAAPHSTAARRERQSARALGTARVRRRIGERAPDVEPVTTSSGVTLQAEVKSRARLPFLRLALAGPLTPTRADMLAGVVLVADCTGAAPSIAVMQLASLTDPAIRSAVAACAVGCARGLVLVPGAWEARPVVVRLPDGASQGAPS